MGSYTVDDREKELDIKQLILYMLDNIKWAILVGLLCGLLLGAYGYMKAYKSDSPEAASASVQDIIKKNRTKWNGIDTSVTADAFNDPLPGTYIANAKIYVDFDYSNIEGNDNLDFSAMNAKLQGDIVALSGSNELKQSIIDELNLHSYDDMVTFSYDDLKYMTYCGFSGANIMQIQVVDSNEERVVNITRAMANKIVESVSRYDTVDDIRIIDDAHLSYYTMYHELGTNGYIKSAIKYGVIGVLLGVILVFGISFLLYILIETVRTSDDLKNIGINVIGIIPEKKGKREKELKRLINGLSFLEKDAITLIPIDDTVSLDEINENVLKKYKNTIKVSESILDNPDAIFEAKKTGNVILVSRYGKTLVKNIEFTKNELDKAKIEVLGSLILEAKHI